MRLRVNLALFSFLLTAIQSTTQDRNQPNIDRVDDASYAVYSAIVEQHYGNSTMKAPPLKIAAYTQNPDRNHGDDLMARCEAGAENEQQRELIRRLFSEKLRTQKLERKLNISGRYSIVEGKIKISEGGWPGILWLSPVLFSRDGLHAVVWVRNFCGGLCGTGRVWTLTRTTSGWRTTGTVPKCGFVS